MLNYLLLAFLFGDESSLATGVRLRLALSLVVEGVSRLHFTLVHAHGLLAFHMVARLGLHGRISVFTHILSLAFVDNSKSKKCKSDSVLIKYLGFDGSLTYTDFKK